MSRRTNARLAASLVLLGTNALACNGLFDLDAFPRGQPEQEATPSLDYASAACAECMPAQCAVELDACFEDDLCFGLQACISQCPVDDAACRVACTEDPSFLHDDALHRAVDDCRRSQCLAPCLGTGGLAPTGASADCATCVDDVCADLTAACVSHPGCEEIVACTTAPGCDDPECFLRCAYDQVPWTMDAEIEPLVDEVRACWGDCSACNVGKALECGGDFTWGQTNESTITITLGVTALKGVEVPAEGVVVRACQDLDLDCVQMQDEAVVGPDGRVELTVPTQPSGWTGYLEFSGTMPPPIGTEVYPLRYYFGRPITRDERLTTVSVIDADSLAVVAAIAGTTVDPSMAHLAVVAADCSFYRGQGVRFATEGEGAQSVAFYSRGSAIEVDDGSLVTDETGAAGFLNLEPSTSPREVRAFVPGTVDVPVGRYRVLLRPGELTGIHAVPSPDP